MTEPFLYARRYSTGLTSGYPTTALETIYDVADVGLRWELPGGLRKMELTVRARSTQDARVRQEQHHGHRLCLLDNYADVVADGWIGEVQRDGRHITYVAYGPWWAHEFYTDESESFNLDSVDSVIESLLTTYLSSFVNSDYANVEANTTDVAQWSALSDILSKGETIQAIFEALVEIPDSGNDQYDYWLQPAPLYRGKPGLPLAYYQARQTGASVTADWLISEDMLVRGHGDTSSHIREYANDITVWYGSLGGTSGDTHTAGASTDDLEDSGATFVTDGVQPGDQVINLTRRAAGSTPDSATITKVDGETEVTTDGGGLPWATNDRWVIRLQELRSVNDTVAANPWTSKRNVTREELNKDQATLLVTQLLNLYSQPLHQKPIVLGSRILRNGKQGNRALWRVLRTGGYVRGIDFDIQPNPNIAQNAFIITAADYEYADNTLRLVLSLPDTRLDAIFSEAGIGPGGEMVATGGRPEEAPGAWSHRR